MTNEKQTFHIEGMHCAACANTVEKKLKAILGIEDVSVSFGNESAEIHYNPRLTNLTQWNEGLKAFGYGVSAFHFFNEERWQENEKQKKNLRQRGKQLFLLVGITSFAFVLMGLEILFQQNPNLLAPEAKHTFHLVCDLLLFFLATFVLITQGKPYFLGVWNLLLGKNANMESLIGLSVSAAYIYSAVTYIFKEFFESSIAPTPKFFEVVIFTITFVRLGKYLEDRAKVHTRNAVMELVALQAKSVKVLKFNTFVEIPFEEVVVGDICLVNPWNRIPMDGKVKEGMSFVNESMITGEAVPVLKKVGEKVIAGTQNQNGVLKILVEKTQAESLLAKIITVVEKAQASKTKIETKVDRIASKFVPAVLVFTFFVFALWFGLGFYFKEPNFAWVNAFTASMSVLAIACPCALGLATPLAMIAGIGKGAKQGILFKNGTAIEKLRGVEVLCIDKTGTLTYGKPIVKKVQNFSSFSNEKVLEIFASLEANSEHPLARAICEYAHQNYNSAVWVKNEKGKQDLVQANWNLKVENFVEEIGVGVQGKIEGQNYQATSFHQAQKQNLQFPSHFQSEEGGAMVVLAKDKNVLAVAYSIDKAKEGSIEAIKELKNLKIKTIMLTGDRKNQAENIAQETKVDQFFYELTPLEKMEKIKALQKENFSVGMVGDGINDAPSLATADVGIALSRGSEIAIESAEIVLLDGNLRKLSTAILLSRKTYRILYQNLIWAFVFNLTAIPLAAGIFYPFNGWLLDPIYSGAMMAFSSLTVVCNSLRIKL